MDEISDYEGLLLNATPLLDVRAPVEFAKGSFPAAENHPLLNDDERHQVGIRYKEAGQQAAIDRGHELVHGQLKEERIAAWREFARRHPEGALFCFRGGLRSRIVQDWLHEAGIDYPRIAGGYKAMRRFLLDAFEQAVPWTDFELIAGRTGTGKTRLIHERSDAIDLEGLAHHRGSAFGRRPGGQPAQIDFENRLIIALLRQRAAQTPSVLLEDESHLIGRCHLPTTLQEKMKASPRIEVDEPLDSRVQVTLEDFVLHPLDEYRAWYGDAEAQQKLGAELLAALDRIRKRLGGARHQTLRAELENALREQQDRNNPDAHREWIAALLTDYYDPMYDYMLSKRGGTVLFRGRRDEVRNWLNERDRQRGSPKPDTFGETGSHG
jgi:tRNA 2-selenouridine synthase